MLIADITGYTIFLKESELEHAHGVLSDLLTVLVDGTRPPLTISRLEGDAVFSYGIDVASMSGQTFVEMIENVYVAFRRAMEQIMLNSTCGCNACANIGMLDLKFIIHYGSFLVQNIGSYSELVGLDVNTAHRLAKNRVTESLGIKAYSIYSSAAVEGLGIADLASDWLPHHEVYDTGDIDCWVVDMSPVWEDAKNRSVIDIPESEVRIRGSVEISLPVERVWDRLATAEYRSMLVGSDRQIRTKKSKRRLGVGDVYDCYHGDNVLPSAVLEWVPFTRILTKDEIHVPGSTVGLMVDYTLEAIEGGTRLAMAGSRPTGSVLGRSVFPKVVPQIAEAVGDALIKFKERLESEATPLVDA
jgi:Protein of unknown function (DUF2652)